MLEVVRAMPGRACAPALAPLLAPLLALLLLAGAPAPAAADWRADLGTPVLVGQGEMRYWGFHVYHAFLWSDRLPFDASHAFALELQYERSISREVIVSASIDEMARMSHTDPASDGSAVGKAEGKVDGGAGDSDATVRARLETWRTWLMRALVDVHDGDRLIGLYRPGAGVRFYCLRAGQPEQQLADIDDEAFAHAFFGIWLDRRTREPRLRTRLLGAGS